MSLVLAVYEDGVWRAAQQSVLSVFGDDREEFSESWPRSGAVRGGRAGRLESEHEPPRDGERLWPTPAASLPNDGEEPAQWLERFVRNATKAEGATRAGVPLAVAARAPSVLLLASVTRVEEAREALRRHAEEPDPELGSTELLNPRWVEHLMGFPEGWTET
jgi:hypothetical protein